MTSTPGGGCCTASTYFSAWYFSSDFTLVSCWMASARLPCFTSERISSNCLRESGGRVSHHPATSEPSSQSGNVAMLAPKSLRYQGVVLLYAASKHSMPMTCDPAGQASGSPYESGDAI